ncbi:hypothetical protein ASG88_16525 [Nocardioides sp. Soil777]|uniref:hypothetical protein n=1 Tax=Nocardioides sp. Soil777 TaxID=1736409 RepID=UPI0007035B65|nr:hypothetical protein [Nocardioides sp. Soil777]KRE98661.1 hypothetical protein ASG88_16525 [Nocardioides sp. Soil777]
MKNMVVRALAITTTVVGPVALLAAPSNAADDGHGNSFNIRESSVEVVGNRCATIHYNVDGWSAGYDAEDTMGSAYVETFGVVGSNIEGYDWWDWNDTEWDEFSWSGERSICDKEDITRTGNAEFDVFPDTDLYDYVDGYSTVVTDSVLVDYHPVNVKASNSSHAVKVKVLKDGEPYASVKVSGPGVTSKTDARGVAMLPKSRLPIGKRVTVTVGGDIAKKTIRVTR